MKITRTLTYEGPDEAVEAQLKRSLADGEHDYLPGGVTLTVDTGGRYAGGVRLDGSEGVVPPRPARRSDEDPRQLTGAEARRAARRGLEVRYIEDPLDPNDDFVDEESELTKIEGDCYYVGPSDVDLSEFGDDDLVGGDEPGCTWGLYAVRNQNYAE